MDAILDHLENISEFFYFVVCNIVVRGTGRKGNRGALSWGRRGGTCHPVHIMHVIMESDATVLVKKYVKRRAEEASTSIPVVTCIAPHDTSCLLHFTTTPLFPRFSASTTVCNTVSQLSETSDKIFIVISSDLLSI